MVAYEFSVSIRIMVCGYRENRHPVAQLMLHLDERRHLLNAGCTPARPKVQDHNTSFVVVQRDGSLRVGDGKVRGRAADQLRPGAAITPNKRQKKCNECGRADSDR